MAIEPKVAQPGRIPSAPQAKLLASLFGDDKTVRIPATDYGFATPTALACLRHGWLEDRGGSRSVGFNEVIYTDYHVSPAGLFALEKFLFRQRTERP